MAQPPTPGSVRLPGLPASAMNAMQANNTNPPITLASTVEDVGEILASGAFALAGSMCSLYAVVIPGSVDRPLADVEDELALWAVPSRAVVVRAIGYNTGWTVLWVARAVVADMGASVLTHSVLGETLNSPVGATVAVTAGVLSTCLFAPAFMQLDRCTVQGRLPSLVGLVTDAETDEDKDALPSFGNGVVQDVVVLTLAHDTVQALVPAVTNALFGYNVVSSVLGYGLGVLLLRPMASTKTLCAVANVRAQSAWSQLYESDAATAQHDTSSSPSMLAKLPPYYRSVLVELATTAAAAGVHIGLLLTVSVLQSALE